MNQAFNPVFAFKRLMGDENANNVILRFMCHPVLWEAISDEKIFLKLIDLFGSDIENWTPKNICKNAAEIRETNNLSVNQETNWNSLERADQLVDIYKSVIQIEGQKQDNKTWGEIFEELQLSEIEEGQIIEKWGLVFEIITNDESERKRLKEINQLKNALCTNITHEFRTP